jgi:ectoine hydroxylase-related dioxygenase (phytanoyl-CoA dioxygenase family)
MVSLATALLGPCTDDHLVQIINQTHFKEANDGVGFPWHQDSKHRRMAQGAFIDTNGRGSYINVTVAIDGENEDNGPLGVIPDTHRDGHLGGIEGLDPQTVDESTSMFPMLERGDALVIGPYIVHGSKPSRAGWRRSFINGFALPSAIVQAPSRDTPSMSHFRRIDFTPDDKS